MKATFMPKTIYCHPDNIKCIKEQVAREEAKDRDSVAGMIHFIRPQLLDGIKVVGDIHIPKERHNGKYTVEGNRFYSWWDGCGEPPSWAIFFGLVKPVMEPVFYAIEDRITQFDPFRFKIPITQDRRGIVRPTA
jgi:hypothetical protein